MKETNAAFGDIILAYVFSRLNKDVVEKKQGGH
jgi:hypothetical protein